MAGRRNVQLAHGQHTACGDGAIFLHVWRSSRYCSDGQHHRAHFGPRAGCDSLSLGRSQAGVHDACLFAHDPLQDTTPSTVQLKAVDEVAPTVSAVATDAVSAISRQPTKRHCWCAAFVAVHQLCVEDHLRGWRAGQDGDTSEQGGAQDGVICERGHIINAARQCDRRSIICCGVRGPDVCMACLHCMCCS